MTLLWVAGLTLLAVAAALLEARRRRELRLRRAAELRVALLETARSLPGRELSEAARIACRRLRSLGFDTAAVSVRRGAAIVPLHLEGPAAYEQPLSADDSFSGRCLAENRTLVVSDYASLPEHLPERADLRSVVLTPVRVDGRPVATLSAARRRVAEPTAQEIAIAETVAIHLGRAFETESAVAAQQELLDRMRRLEEMRSAFVGRVSAELRDRLAVIRDLAAALDTASPLPAARRGAVLDDLRRQADGVRGTIDALLDFSRFQSDRREPQLVPVTVADLLAALRRTADIGIAATPEADGYVHVDADLVRHALELLLAGRREQGRLEVRVDDRGVSVILGPSAPGHDRGDGGLVGSLAGQLLLAAGAGLSAHGGEVAVHLPWWSET